MGRLHQRLLQQGLLCVACGWLLLSSAVPATAQSDPAQSDPAQSAPDSATTDSATTANGVTCEMGPKVGARRYRPGVWGLVEVFAINRTDQAAETASVLCFAEDPTLQYGRNVLVPAHSILRLTCPVLVPDFISPTTKSAEFFTQQVGPSLGDNVKYRTAVEVKRSSQLLPLDHETPAVGIIGDATELQPLVNEFPYYTGQPPAPPPECGPYELAVAAKRYRDLSRRISTFEPKDLPPDPGCLDVLGRVGTEHRSTGIRSPWH